MIIYRKLNVIDVSEITLIHIKSFKDFFLTSLGKRFLNTYYKSCLKSAESIAICAIDENQNLVGFSVGCVHSKGFHKRLIKKSLLDFMVQGIIILFSNPKAIIRLLNNLGKNTNKEDNGNYAELLSIGVLPNFNGYGIGKELIKRFEEEAKLRNAKEIALTTDLQNNDRVLEFYYNNGYSIYYDFIAYPNRKMYKLIKKLKN
jgi:ribosomal protein S18 acetylase RimI-like enzyme